MRRSVEGLRAAIFEMRLEETAERSVASSLEALVEVNRRMARRRYNVDLTVESGTIHALIGPNGAGKTTTFYIATGIEKPNQGNVWLDNRNITYVHPEAFFDSRYARLRPRTVGVRLSYEY